MTLVLPHWKVRYDFYRSLVEGVKTYIKTKVGDPPQSMEAEAWLKKTCEEAFPDSFKDVLIKLGIGGVATLPLGVKRYNHVPEYYFVSGSNKMGGCLVKFSFDTFYAKASGDEYYEDNSAIPLSYKLYFTENV